MLCFTCFACLVVVMNFVRIHALQTWSIFLYLNIISKYQIHHNIKLEIANVSNLAKIVPIKTIINHEEGKFSHALSICMQNKSFFIYPIYDSFHLNCSKNIFITILYFNSYDNYYAEILKLLNVGFVFHIIVILLHNN